MDEAPSRHETTGSRRTFLRNATLATGSIILLWPEDTQVLSPTEDLMREHGLLKRILLIYEDVANRLSDGRDAPPIAIANAAGIVRRVIQEHHEMLEEEFLFPRFDSTGRLPELVGVLRLQHRRGRELTGRIQQNATLQGMQNQDARRTLGADLHSFARMIQAHGAWEDTLLFPAFRSIVTLSEYNSMGKEFRKRQQAVLGQDGFEKCVESVGQLEKTLHIADLGRYTPDPA